MITGVVLARNEESNIIDCLRSLRPAVQEIILIDMESSDRTVEYAKPFVDKVLRHPLVERFDAARNIAIPEARFDWLWFVDADERISLTTGQAINNILTAQGGQWEAISIPFKSYFCGQWMQHCGWWPGYTMPRVLKRGYFKFRDQLHGGVEVNGRQAQLPPDPALGIDHYSYRSIEHYVEKLNRYTSTEAHQLAESGANWDWRHGVREMVRDLWLYYERNAGHMDRERGWILSWLSGQYRWLSRAKLIDLKGPSAKEPGPANVPATLEEVTEVWRAEVDRLRAMNPMLPLGIVWHSPIWDPSGYSEESRVLLRGLACGPRELQLTEIPWSDKKCVLSSTSTSLLRALARAERPKYTAAITNCIPGLAEPDPRASLNILRTTFETDRIPRTWHEHLDKFDEIWVISKHNERAFRQSGVAPEKLRVVPSCVDTELYSPAGPPLTLTPELEGRFVFLSVFDWQLRKGWDVLLRAYCAAFGPDDGVGLLLKITRAHGHSSNIVRRQADTVLLQIDQSLASRPDIVIWDRELTETEMAGLYRSAGAFVLASRGEGWGRPYMEAMASGIPTIGTMATGNMDFMTCDNSFLVGATSVAVPEQAAEEIPVYSGHHWQEPDEKSLFQVLQTVRHDRALRDEVAARGLADVRSRFSKEAGAEAFELALSESEQRFAVRPLPAPRGDQIRVALEGEFFALHSFSIINEHLLAAFSQDDSIAIGAVRRFVQPTFDNEMPHRHRIQPAVERSFQQGPQVTIRHAFPPNWESLPAGKWVHIQPWEYGHLPKEWLAPLQSAVDEIWAPSNFVRDVYIRSGVPREKIQVIPWGVDADVYSPIAPPRHLPTNKSFRFLFVGGAIPRKGIDVLLAAYLAEFGPDDDVCLVVKDMGTQSFYRDCTYREELLRVAKDSANPQILYFDDRMTAGQLASLYTACHCLVAPYRGEGFGLPILEAMACGLVPIVPRGGPSDDFTNDNIALRMPSQTIETTHTWPLCGPATELKVTVDTIRAAMRMAYEERESLSTKGAEASRCIRSNWTWSQTVALMSQRIHHLVDATPQRPIAQAMKPFANGSPKANSPTITAFLAVRDDERILADTLCRVAPFVDHIVVDKTESKDRSESISREYGAELVTEPAHLSSEWIFCLHPGERPADDDMIQLRRHLQAIRADTTSIAVQLRRKQNGSPNCRPEYRLFRNRPGLNHALRNASALSTFLAKMPRGQEAIELTIDELLIS